MIKTDKYNIYIDTKDGGVVTVAKADYSNIIKCEEFLNKFTFKELCDIFIGVLGLPSNLKQILLKKIELYDNSQEVNSFIFQGNKYWLGKDQRNCMLNLCSSAKEDESLEIILGDNIVNLPVKMIIDFLHNLEKYAYKCYVNTQKHLVAASKLKAVEDMMNYDYTQGYPEMLTIE